MKDSDKLRAFISKWSNWWILRKDVTLLNEAFKRELKDVIAEDRKPPSDEEIETVPGQNSQ